MLTSARSHPFSKKVESQSQDDSANRKINRKTTPLLYYLTGEKNTNIMSNPNQAQLHQDFEMQFPRSDHSVFAKPVEMPRANNSWVNDVAASQKTGLILGSPASSVDEKFKNDYREKLKVAQSKVLRETSFKRKDLQMSLPIRLKQKPSSKPSIPHLRSWSLSNPQEDSRLIPSPKPLENINKQEEPQRPHGALTGGRKRITKGQKKISYSEPEKLNQLDDERDHNTTWKKKNPRSRSDEISEQGPVIISNKGLENPGRALSKGELKQIQHEALLQYMERKIGQRPDAAQTNPLRKDPLQAGPSHARTFSEDSFSNLNSNKKSQNVDSSCQFSDLGRNLEAPTLPSSILPVPDMGRASSSVFEEVNWGRTSAVHEGNCVSRCTSTKSLLYLGASVSSKDRGRSKSMSSPVQDFYKSSACPELSSQEDKYYFSQLRTPSKEELEADPSDCFRTTKQNSYRAGRRGRSLEETGSSEVAMLSPLSQRPNDQNSILQNWEPASRPLLPRPSHHEGVSGLKRLNPVVQTLEQSPSTNKHSATSMTLGHPSLSHMGPSNSVGRLQFQSVPLEPPHSSPPPFSAKTDHHVFKDSSSSGDSEKTISLCFLYKQKKNSILDRTQTEPALNVSASKASLEGKQIKECNSRFYIPKKEESSFGNRNGNSEENVAVENSHCPETASECSAFVFKERIKKDSQLQKERNDQSQMNDASGRLQWQQQLKMTHRREGYSSEDMTDCATIMDNQGDENTDHPSAKVEQNEHYNTFQEQDTKLSTVPLKCQEDQRCENTAIKITAKGKPLFDILRPPPTRKSALDLMEGLFPVNILVTDRSLKIKRQNQSLQENDQINREGAPDLFESGHSLEQGAAHDPTSHTDQILSCGRERLEDPENISEKKELISNIHLKLQALRGEKELIQAEAQEHAAWGKELAFLVQNLCKPNEYERYMMFIGDLEKVVSLLLCLSSRLAQVQNTMEKMDENTDAEERQSLNERHNLLSRQWADAKDLKENLDRRESVVSGILSKYLTGSQLQEYQHFVQVKTSLLIEQKDIEEQIKSLEEQLERLEESIPP